jgi:hypothetical protein
LRLQSPPIHRPTTVPPRRPGARRADALAAGVVAVLLAAGLAGCQRQSPEERLAEARGKYEARLNGFIVRETPTALDVEVVTPDPGDPAAAATAEAAEAAAEAELVDEAEHLSDEAGAALEPTGPQRRDVVLDIVVTHTADEALPGITLDVTQADEEENVKETFLVWIDTAHISRGEHAQVNYVLEDIEFEPGDRFSVEVRHPVPAADRGRYRELTPAAL